MIFSQTHSPSFLNQWMMLAESAAPTKPWLHVGVVVEANLQRDAARPRPDRWVFMMRFFWKSQKWMRRPYLRCPTSSRSKPGMKVLGAAHSLETMTLWRGWYQKS